MVGEKLKIKYLDFSKTTIFIVVLGSIITPWLIILGDYLWSTATKSTSWFYSSFSVLEMQLLCVPLVGYQTPSYLIGCFVFAALYNCGILKSVSSVYFLTGSLGFLLSTSLIFISNVTLNKETLLTSLVMAAPTLLITYLFKLGKNQRTN